MDHFDVEGQGANKTLSCKWCPNQFVGAGTRAYVHLTGDGKGVAVCKNVPKAVADKLKAAKIAKDQAKRGSKRAAPAAADPVEERRSSHAAAGPGPSSAQQTVSSGTSHPLRRPHQAA
jgi:hypothetical protein